MCKKHYIKIFNFLLAIYPILDVYSSGIIGLSIGQLALIIVLLFYIVLYPKNIKISPLPLIYLGYMIFRHTILIFAPYNDIGVSTYNLLSQLLAWFMLLVGFNLFDLTYFKKYLFKVTALVVIMAIVQFVLLETGIKFLFIIPNIPLSIDVDYDYLFFWLSRAEACFTEPAHLAQFLSVPLILILCCRNENINQKQSDIARCRIKTTILTIGILLAMLFTFSGNAVVIMLCILVAFLIERILYKKKYISSIIFILLMIITAAILYNLVPQLQDLFGRVSEITERNGSGYVRIFHGFDVYSRVPLGNKIFGIGYGNIKSFAQYYNNIIFSKISISNPLFEYLNGIQYVLLGGGIIGFVLYIAILLSCIKKGKPLGLYVIITFIVISFVSAFVAGGLWLTYMMLLFSEKPNNMPSKKYVSCGVPLKSNKSCSA